MPKTFEYSANTTTDDIQYSVTATYNGTLSKEIEFIVPEGEECRQQDIYVLNAPEKVVHLGSKTGNQLTIPITSTLNGANFDYIVYTSNLSGTTLVSKNDTSIVIRADQDNTDTQHKHLGEITIVQVQKNGITNTKTFEVYQRVPVTLGVSRVDDNIVITASSPVYCEITGEIESAGSTYSFTMESGSTNAKVNVPSGSLYNTYKITSVHLNPNCSGYDMYDLFV